MALNYRYANRNKYNAKKTKYDDRLYDSALEASYAADLDWKIKAGVIKEVIPQFKISLDINGVHIANYFVDFKVIYPDGHYEFHEVKGMETDVWRMKWRIAKALHPDVNFILIK